MKQQPVPDLAPGDVFEWCGRPVRLLSASPKRPGRSVALTVIDTTDDRRLRLYYDRTETVRVPS